MSGLHVVACVSTAARQRNDVIDARPPMRIASDGRFLAELADVTVPFEDRPMLKELKRDCSLTGATALAVSSGSLPPGQR